MQVHLFPIFVGGGVKHLLGDLKFFAEFHEFREMMIAGHIGLPHHLGFPFLGDAILHNFDEIVVSDLLLPRVLQRELNQHLVDLIETSCPDPSFHIIRLASLGAPAKP